MRTTSTSAMVIMPQMPASDAQKGITRRLHVLNADATKLYGDLQERAVGLQLPRLEVPQPGRTASTSTRSRWDRR
jgi:hypothetical protein